MMMCRITNTTPMNIVIEDLGVQLQPVGGNGSFVSIRADVADRSVDLKRHSKWIKIETFEVVSSENRPPRPTFVPTVLPAAPVEIAEPPVQPSVQPSAPSGQSDEFDRLHKTIDEMRTRQEELYRLLEFAIRSVPARQEFADAPRQVREPNSAPIIYHNPVHDPVILGKIVPNSVEMSVQAKEDEHGSDDFDSALEALKKFKRK